MEVELKYGFCSERTFQQLLEATTLGGLRLETAQVLQVHDRYLDTPDRALLRAGYACRLRHEQESATDHEGGRYLATVKGLGDASGAYHRRVEHEFELPRPLPPTEWPPGPARDLILSLCGPCALLPLFDVAQERHRRRLYDGDRAVAEVSLDRVRFHDAGHRAGEERASSLEFEAELLVEGNAEDLERLAAELDGFEGLVPRIESKFEQGLALLDQAVEAAAAAIAGEFVPPGRAKPRPHTPDPDDPMSEAGREILWYHFQVMVYNEPGTRLGEDAEALHDMRVATRRMRAAFRVFGDHFDAQSVAPHLKGLKRTGRALGPVRDLDVLKEKAQAYVDTLPEPQKDGLEGLFEAIDQHRQTARQRMLRWLDSPKYARFKERFALFLNTEGLGALPVAPGDGDPRPYRLRHVAPMMIYERLADVWAYDEWVLVPNPPLARLHALRIACKRLRYTLEFFEQVLGPETRAAIKQVVAVQDHLGALQDAVVAGDILRQFLATGTWGQGVEEPGVLTQSPGVEAYLAARQAEVQQLVEAFPPVWQQITSTEFSNRMAGIVAGL